ncbi:MAG: glucokinase [Solirubrobacterales bacterium]|nr:glucokinase [Solirubrobacterales bacterium]
MPSETPALLLDDGWLARDGGEQLLFGERLGAVIGISVNRESISWVVSGPTGPVKEDRLDRDVAPIEGERASPEQVRDYLAEAFAAAGEHLPKGALAGVGVAWPGAIGRDGEPTDPRFHHDGFRDRDGNGALPVTPLVREAMNATLGEGAGGAEVVMVNDADADLLYEIRFGVARGARNVVGVKICGGLGMSAVHDGHLVRGENGSAGEIQHIKVRTADAPLHSKWDGLKDLEDLPPCWCESRECIGRFATGAALVDQLGHFAPHGSTATSRGREIELDHGLDVIAAVFNRAGRLLGQAMIGPILALDPEMVVVSAFPRNDQILVGMQSRLTGGRVKPQNFVLGTPDRDTTAAGAAQLVIEEVALPRIEDRAPTGEPKVLRRELPLWLRRQIPSSVRYVGEHRPRYGARP